MKHLTRGLVLILSLFAVVQANEFSRSLATTHYRIMLTIGPIPKMLNPDEAKGAKRGEVMVGNSMIISEDKKVNYHLEIVLVNRATGKHVTALTPIVVVTDANDQKTVLGSMMQMYDVTKGQADIHFGTNLFLTRNPYTVRVTVKGETVIFNNVKL